VTGGGWHFCAMRLCLTRRITLFSFLFILLTVFNTCGGIGLAKAADSRGQLVMITSSHCPWCEAFEDDVGKGYDRTEEALVYPLRRHDFYQEMPNDLVHLTPATIAYLYCYA